MKLKLKHIKVFEDFIKNENEDELEPKNKLKIGDEDELDTDYEEGELSDEEDVKMNKKEIKNKEKDLIEELNRYYKKKGWSK